MLPTAPHLTRQAGQLGGAIQPSSSSTIRSTRSSFPVSANADGYTTQVPELRLKEASERECLRMSDLDDSLEQRRESRWLDDRRSCSASTNGQRMLSSVFGRVGYLAG